MHGVVPIAQVAAQQKKLEYLANNVPSILNIYMYKGS